MPKALIDGDIVAYMAAILAEEDAFPPLPGQSEEDCKPTADPKKAKRIAREIMDKWEHVAGCGDRRIAMSDRSSPRASFRYQVHPHYKNQRVDDKPLLLDEVEDYLVKHHGAEAWPSLEGDDLLSIWQDEANGRDVVVSKDKDMMTIRGNVLIIPHMKTTDKLKPVKVSGKEAMDSLFMQVLTGDSVDNYAGAPGIGAKAAAKWLKAYHEEAAGNRWKYIVDAYSWAWENRPRYHSLWVHPGNPEEEALMNMRCARLLKSSDYKAVVGGSVGLWLPNGEREWI